MRLVNITKYGIFLYAYTEDNKQQFKQGQVTRQKYIVSRDFDYIDDDITIFYAPSGKEGEKDNLRKEYFYFVNFGKDYSITKTFNCDDGDSLKLN